MEVIKITFIKKEGFKMAGKETVHSRKIYFNVPITLTFWQRLKFLIGWKAITHYYITVEPLFNQNEFNGLLIKETKGEFNLFLLEKNRYQPILT